MPTRVEMEPRIRELAAERGLDPDRWVKIITGESRWNPAARAVTNKEDSRGLLQLNVKGGLGAEALKRGISLAPENWEQQAAFGMDHAVKHGDHAWTVARQLDGRPTPGIPINPVVRGDKQMVADSTPLRRPDGAPGPVNAETPTLPQNVDKGVLASLYSPFEKIAEQQKETQRTLDETQKAAMAQLNQPAAAPPPQQPPVQPPPVQPSAPDANFAALMLPRIRRGLLADTTNYGLLS